MSNKDRQKKDHRRKDKDNKAMREAQGNPRKQVASPRHQAKDESNFTDSEAGPDSARTGRPIISGGRNR
jgi:hypothetical protein